MTKAVVAIDPQSTVRDAGEILRERRISGLPVMDGESVVGMITVTAIMRFILANIYQPHVTRESMPDLRLSDLIDSEKLNVKVNQLMTRPVRSLDEEDSVDEVMKLMFVENKHTLPVIKDGRLIGVVGRRDLVEVM